MMSDDDSRAPSSRPAARLLDELEAIKGTLRVDQNATTALPADIPLLDDMVIDNLDSNAKLLNIEQIFDECMNEENTTGENPVAETVTTAAPPMQFPRFTLDVTVSDDNEFTPPKPSAEPSATQQRPRVRPDYSREALIQELVDEFIPQIEAELNKRLHRLDDASLHRLKDSK